jgi:hypothetical protein
MELPYGAKHIAHAYMMKYIEERNEEIEALQGKEG